MDGIKKGKSLLAKLGPWLFLFGIIIAILVGILLGADYINTYSDNWGYIAGALAGLGFLVGLISAVGLGTITKHEISQFLIAATALVAVGLAGTLLEDIPVIGVYFSNITLCMLLFFGPAAVVIALKTLWDLGKD